MITLQNMLKRIQLQELSDPREKEQLRQGLADRIVDENEAQREFKSKFVTRFQGALMFELTGEQADEEVKGVSLVPKERSETESHEPQSELEDKGGRRVKSMLNDGYRDQVEDLRLELL